MKIICPNCGSKMAILRSLPVTNELRNFAAECTNFDCRAKGVFNLAFSHYIRPPESCFDEVISQYLSTLPSEDFERLKKQAQVKKQGELF